MTNPSPPEPQNPIPERRQRPAAGVTFDEMIAIIVAFSTIGAILFWSIGSRGSRFARNFGLGNNLLDSDRTLDTGLGLGNNLLTDRGEDLGLNSDLELENRRLTAQLKEQAPLAYIPPSQELDLSPQARARSYQFDSGARLVPLTGLTTAPTIRNRLNEEQIIEESELETEPSVIPQEPEIEAEPEAIVPEPALESEPEVEPEAVPETETEPSAVVPSEETAMPRDVRPDYWAYPFVKQIRDNSLVPEIARNQNFEPDTLITRASMATLISQAFDTLPLTENIKTFQDVTNRNAIAQDIDKAVRLGFMQGYSENEFRPLENIPRYQVLVALATGLGLEPSQDAEQILQQQFNDSEGIPDWARQQVAAATEAGLVVNPPDANPNTLLPEEPASRAEVAAMIHQALVQTGTLQPLESEYIVNP